MNAKTTLREEDILEVTREIKRALLEADVNLLVVKEFVKSVRQKAIGSEIIGRLNPGQQMIKIVRDELVSVLGSKAKEVKVAKPLMIIMMTGLQGSGKTTTSAKLVRQLTKKNGITKAMMVAADVYRPAAIEQLITLGKELKIDVYSEKDNKEPTLIVKSALAKARSENYDLLVIDTAGRLAIDEKLMEELVQIKSLARPNEIFFVADALSGQDIINVAKSFHEKLKLTGAIITKLDSDARGGASLSIRQILQIPIAYIGTGEKIANLDLFYPERMAERILGMGDVLTLIDQVGEVIDEKKAGKLMNRMSKGHFDLNDLLEQLGQIKKMGKMSKFIKMIPGLSNKISPEKMATTEQKLGLYEIIISSMTSGERKNPKLLKNASRKQRVLKGSGRSAQEYNSLMNEFEKMSKQMKNVAKSMKDGTFNPNMLGTTGM